MNKRLLDLNSRISNLSNIFLESSKLIHKHLPIKIDPIQTSFNSLGIKFDGLQLKRKDGNPVVVDDSLRLHGKTLEELLDLIHARILQDDTIITKSGNNENKESKRPEKIQGPMLAKYITKGTWKKDHYDSGLLSGDQGLRGQRISINLDELNGYKYIKLNVHHHGYGEYFKSIIELFDKDNKVIGYVTTKGNHGSNCWDIPRNKLFDLYIPVLDEKMRIDLIEAWSQNWYLYGMEFLKELPKDAKYIVKPGLPCFVNKQPEKFK